MTNDQPDTSAWEPTASIVLSGVAAAAGVIGLVLSGWCLAQPRQRGLEHIGGFLLMAAAMAGTLAANVFGMIAAGIGLRRSKNRNVRTPALNVTFIANLVEFVLVFLLPGIIR